MPTGVALLHDPAFNKGTAFSRARARRARPARAAAAARVHAGGAGRARARELPAQADAAREVHRPRRPARPQRGAVLPAAHRPSRRDAADRLHADGRPRLPAVRPHLPAAARPLRQRARPRLASAGARQLAAARRRDHRGDATASASSASATSAPTAWASRSASSRCTRRARACIPNLCLPVLLDVGTNNPRAAQRPALPRPAGAAPDRRRLRRARRGVRRPRRARSSRTWSIQFEDFANHNAFRLLERYRDRIPTFNDDIQGTAAVTLAGIISALRVTGGRLTEQTHPVPGRGEAATGIANLTVSAMVAQGLTPEAARRRCWLVDSQGLVRSVARRRSPQHKRPFAHEHAPVADLLGAVRAHAADRDHRRGGGRRRVHRGACWRRWPGSTSGRSSSRCPIRRRNPSARR